MDCVICMDRVSTRKGRRRKMPCCKSLLHTSCHKQWMDQNLTSPRCPGCNTGMPTTDLDAYQERIDEFIETYRFAAHSRNNMFATLENDQTLVDDDLHIEIKEDGDYVRIRVRSHEITLLFDHNTDEIPAINIRDLHEMTGCLARKRTVIVY